MPYKPGGKMILSAKVIKAPKMIRYCADCDYPISGGQLKLYGMAEPEEKPFNIFLHPNCAVKGRDVSREPKIEAVFLLLRDKWGYRRFCISVEQGTSN